LVSLQRSTGIGKAHPPRGFDLVRQETVNRRRYEHCRQDTVHPLAGYPRAAELLMLGEPFGAAKARDVGLVTDVVSEAELLAVATAVAEKLADKPPGAFKITKQLLRRALMPQIEAALEEESKHFRALLRSPEAKEAFTAFLEKRKPDSRSSAERVDQSEVL
jgi:1,4-dihydroxy-2-naphthoyl-CoA synthase